MISRFTRFEVIVDQDSDGDFFYTIIDIYNCDHSLGWGWDRWTFCSRSPEHPQHRKIPFKKAFMRLNQTGWGSLAERLKFQTNYQGSPVFITIKNNRYICAHLSPKNDMWIFLVNWIMRHSEWDTVESWVTVYHIHCWQIHIRRSSIHDLSSKHVHHFSMYSLT